MSKDRCKECESGLCHLCAHFEPEADEGADRRPEDDDDDCFGCQELWDTQARIEALEWLVEVMEFFWPAWTGHGADRAASRLWRWEPAMSELKATRKAAMAAVEELSN